MPDGYRVSWLGMFENSSGPREHFVIVIPVTVVLIFVPAVVTFRSLRAALLLLLLGAVRLRRRRASRSYLRGMNLNVSTGVGFAALFGVSIMNGVLMVARRSPPFAGKAWHLRRGDPARLLGTCCGPILMASLVAILGLLPASLATGLGSDVQRPLATVIVWGLFSSTVLTLFVVPVLYYLLAPAVVENK